MSNLGISASTTKVFKILSINVRLKSHTNRKGDRKLISIAFFDTALDAMHCVSTGKIHIKKIDNSPNLVLKPLQTSSRELSRNSN